MSGTIATVLGAIIALITGGVWLRAQRRAATKATVATVTELAKIKLERVESKAIETQTAAEKHALDKATDDANVLTLDQYLNNRRPRKGP